MKKYNKPELELVEVSVKENIAALPYNHVDVDETQGLTTYYLNGLSSWFSLNIL